jgi:hypothetical protein
MDICRWGVACVVRSRSRRRADHSSRGVLPTVLRRCVWPRNIKNGCSMYIYIISSLRVNDLTLILLTWRKWWAPNNASKQQMGFHSAFKGLIIKCGLCNNRFRYLAHPPWGSLLFPANLWVQ